MKHFWLICIAGLLMTGCKKSTAPHDDDTDPNPPPQGIPAITAIGKPTGAAVQKNIGASGGTIVSADGRTRLIIPSGALGTDQTITMQPIEGTAPLRIATASYRLEPHGLQFKKPVQLVLNYSDAILAGTPPELVSIATLQANGSWKTAGKVTVDKTNKTMTADITHFSDYDYYAQFGLTDTKTQGDTALLTLLIREEVGLEVRYIQPAADSSLFVAIPPLRRISQWTVNGESNLPVYSEYGYFKDDSSLLKKTYVAPMKRKAGDTMAISVELKLDNNSLFYLIRRVVIVDENLIKLNGKWFTNVSGGATIENGYLTLVLNDMSDLSRYAAVTVMIAGVNGPGTYSFSGTTVVTGSDTEKDWQSYYEKDEGYVYAPGSVVITSGGKGEGPITGRVEGTLYHLRFLETPDEAPVYATFGVMVRH